MVKKFVFIIFSVILFAGCNTNELEFDNIQIAPLNGTLDVPLGTAVYSIRDLILDQEDSTLDFQVDEDSLITLVYYDSISFNSGADFVDIDNITNQGVVDLTGETTGAGPRTIPLNQSFTFNYTPNDNTDVIDSAFFASGEVTVVVTTDLQGTLDYTLTLNDFVTATNEIPMEVSSANPTRSLSVPQYKALLSSNQFTADFAGTITLGAGDSFNGDEFLNFDLLFTNQTFSVIYGKFGSDTVQLGNETMDIEFFRTMGEDGIFFGNPTISFFFQNSYGIPFGVDFSGFFGDDGQGGAQTFLTGDVVNNPPVVISADVNSPGVSVADTIELNSANSSLVDLLATSPGRLGLAVTAITNPENQTDTNFITESDEITATIEVKIPMEIRLENLEQDVNLSLGDGFDVSDVDSAFLRITTINEMPFSGTLDMEIQDADSNSLFLVTDNFVLEAPFINVNGLVTDPNGHSEDIPLSQAGIEALGTGSRIVMTVTLNTPGSLNSRDIFVKILADYKLEISLGLGAYLNVDI